MDAEKLAMQRRIDKLDEYATRLHAALTEYERENARLKAELETVKRERDAAILDMSVYAPCNKCEHWDVCKDSSEAYKACAVTAFKLWKWRGLCAENGGADE